MDMAADSRRVLVSAGPTRERIDPVRFISNRSSGKMGYAIAAAAAAAGYPTTLVSGPTALADPAGVAVTRVESAAEMAAAVFAAAESADVVVMVAAVADYRPKTVSPGKIKKQAETMTIELERTVDILAELGRRKRPGQLLVGFAAETDDLAANAIDKLRRKNLDWIVANDVSRADRGMESDLNEVVMMDAGGRRLALPLASKTELAAKIIGEIMGHPAAGQARRR